ncbi:MAG: hypothetical protein M3O09_07475 [Acidobacteriota bacterium]|jgi:hypothetical protein|nr:hypothetical protein [Acidobacteriota bacterium]
MLPILLALFVISYVLLTTLVVEQGRTIDNQRFLIRQLFSDSTTLSTIKVQELRKNQAAATADDSGTKNQPTADAQVQTPSSQAAPSVQPKNHQKLGKQSLQKPPKSVDSGDVRRTALTI